MSNVTEKALSKTLKKSDQILPCNICSSSNFSPSLDCKNFKYVRCNDCGLVYQNPLPYIEDVYELYDQSYFDYEIENHKLFYNLMKLGLEDIHFDQLTLQFPFDKKLLDIGCATGLLLNHLREKGWECYGVEICKESANYARTNFKLNVKNKVLEKCLYPDNFFHVIHFSHLIEHISDPKSFMKEVYRILQPGGYIIITTPNVDGLFAKIYGDSWRLAIAQHLYLFSKKTLTQLLEQEGFEILKKFSWGGIPIELTNGPFKKVLDRFVKFFNLGDVTLFLAKK